MELTEKWKLTIQKMQTLLWKETKFHNRIDTSSAWRRPIDSEWIIALVTIPSAFLTLTQEKIALLELECVTCRLEVACPRFQVRIIRISEQTSSWANPTFRVLFRFLVVWLEFIFFNDCWNVDEPKNDGLSVLVSSLINFEERTFLISFLLQTKF